MIESAGGSLGRAAASLAPLYWQVEPPGPVTWPVAQTAGTTPAAGRQTFIHLTFYTQSARLNKRLGDTCMSSVAEPGQGNRSTLQQKLCSSQPVVVLSVMQDVLIYYVL